MTDEQTNEQTPLPAAFTIEQAALVTGRSQSALRRAIKAGKIETTTNPISHAYQMTASALIAAGYTLTSGETAKPAKADNTAEVEYLRRRVNDLEEALAYERERTHAAEQRLDTALEALPRRLFTRKALKRGNA
jgi:RNase H-fold protein (predicted Holliday junction resolvase)